MNVGQSAALLLRPRRSAFSNSTSSEHSESGPTAAWCESRPNLNDGSRSMQAYEQHERGELDAAATSPRCAGTSASLSPTRRSSRVE